MMHSLMMERAWVSYDRLGCLSNKHPETLYGQVVSNTQSIIYFPLACFALVKCVDFPILMVALETKSMVLLIATTL
ncbi:MAG: hypothetical protein CMK46_03195 [Porticoccus sp.]|nr:hypothetical protein [Porticoccus sp.]